MHYCREIYSASMVVDNGDVIMNQSMGPFRRINANSGLYIGKFEDSTTIRQLHNRRHVPNSHRTLLSNSET